MTIAAARRATTPAISPVRKAPARLAEPGSTGGRSTGGHASQSAPPPATPSVIPPAPESTQVAKGHYELSCERDRARAVASRIVANASAATCGTTRLARALGVGLGAVTNWQSPEHRAALTLGDVLAAAQAGETEFAVTTLQAMLAVVQAGVQRQQPASRASIVDQALLLGSGMGQLQHDVCEAARDGHIDSRERNIIGRDARKIIQGARTLLVTLGLPETDEGAGAQ